MEVSEHGSRGEGANNTNSGNAKRTSGYHRLVHQLIGVDLANLPRDHPLYIALRTYIVFLSLSLGPKLVPLLIRRALGVRKSRNTTNTIVLLRNAFGRNGLAFVMATAIGGGATLDLFLERFLSPHANDEHERRGGHFLSTPIRLSFMANAIAASFASSFLQSRDRHGRRTASRVGTPHTLDLALLVLVRGIDALWRAMFLHSEQKSTVAKGKQKDGEETSSNVKKKLMDWTSRLDALLFWAASARIMWCFFYKPHRLPKSYSRWINALANVDSRLIEVLRLRRLGKWTYGESLPTHSILVPMVTDLGYPEKWGNPTYLPPYGGPNANETWKQLGLHNRSTGGLPCEVVHGRVGNKLGPVGRSCSKNALFRGGVGFIEALFIYAPVHIIPVLISKPGLLLSIDAVRSLILSICRSSLFLSTFIASVWMTVCSVRTLFVARLLPFISHNFYDGPYGAILAGSLVCGNSIWIEQGRRRGEIALYVAPKAIRSLFKTQHGQGSKRLMLERVVFITSLSTILTMTKHYPESLRGLTRWIMSFILEGPASWKRSSS